jgi:hypothetical protein
MPTTTLPPLPTGQRTPRPLSVEERERLGLVGGPAPEALRALEARFTKPQRAKKSPPAPTSRRNNGWTTPTEAA